MLGRKLDIEIFGTISEGSIYFGYYRERGMNYKVYILTNHKLKTSEQCIVIAEEFNENSSTKKLVASPLGEIFYEPEIRKRVAMAHTEISHMICLYEKSCGAVVFYRSNDSIKYLLVKNRQRPLLELSKRTHRKWRKRKTDRRTRN